MMKQVRYIIIAIVVTALTLTGYAFAQKKGVKTSNGNDLSVSELKAITIETWDKTEWEVFTDKDSEIPDTYGKKPYKKDLKASSQAMREVKLVKGYPRDEKSIDLSTEKETAQVLAVKFFFTFPGNNEVTVRPPRTEQFLVKRPRQFINDNAFSSEEAKKDPSVRDVNNVNLQPVYGIELPGVTKAISVWVLGRGNDYTLEGWIEDYKGETHILKFGSVNFVGWRPLTAVVPPTIPQFVEAFPATKTLVFKQFKIRSTPKTGGEVTFLFFDQLKVLTDAFDVHFDGASIDFDDEDCKEKQRVEQLEVNALKQRYKDAKTYRDCGGASKSAEKPAKN
jgi:hypothetical protein